VVVQKDSNHWKAVHVSRLRQSRSWWCIGRNLDT